MQGAVRQNRRTMPRTCRESNRNTRAFDIPRVHKTVSGEEEVRAAYQEKRALHGLEQQHPDDFKGKKFTGAGKNGKWLLISRSERWFDGTLADEGT